MHRTCKQGVSHSWQRDPAVSHRLLQACAAQTAEYGRILNVHNSFSWSACCIFEIADHLRPQTAYFMQAPFTYEALPPEKINFVPLKQKKSFNAKELMQV